MCQAHEELRLRTPRLVLRDFRERDLPAVFALRSAPAVARFMDFAPETRDQARSWLDAVIVHDRQRPRRAYNLAITHGADERAIGWIGIGRSERYPGAGELGFGYMLHPAYWGQGYATEAVRATLDFGFTVLGGRRASAWCDAANQASARGLARAGLRFARRYRETDPQGEQPAECLEYAIEAAEWPVARVSLASERAPDSAERDPQTLRRGADRGRDRTGPAHEDGAPPGRRRC